MTHYVLVYKIITSYTGSYPGDGGGSPYTLTADNFLHVKLDDVANTLSLEYSSASTPGAGTIYTASLYDGPPNLYFGYGGVAELLTTSPYYQYCEGTTLHKVGTSNGFPYGTLSNNLNNSECLLAPVCDLDISSLYSITPATGPSNADGEITISAASSNGTIKYSLNPAFVYATDGQTSSTFSGLLPQFYTIYAKDAVGCQDNITFEIPVTTVYGVRHRLDFTDLHVLSGKSVRFDIEERAYVGAIEEMCGMESSPLIVRYEGDRDDPNIAMVPSHTTINIKVETEGQYTHLSTSASGTVDDRKYKGKLYIGEDIGSLELYHVGYAVPQFHQEPYLFPPYPLRVTFSDQLGEMKNHGFYDLYGNKIKGELKIIKVIAEILKKTSLELPIRCGVNVFDSGMTTAATDDPFDQAYIDTRIFRGAKDVPIKCDVVINEIMKTFRAQFFQSQGVWWIIRSSDAVGTFAYREFDVNGDYVSNSTFNPIVELGTPTEIRAGEGMFFINRSQLLEYVKNYGRFSIVNDLKKDGNLIDEGRFESEDIQELASGNQTFNRWNVLLGQGGVKFGHETVVNGDSTGAFYFDLESALTTQTDTILYSDVIPMDESQGHKIRLKFQYFITPIFKVPYIRLAWSFKVRVSTDLSYRWLTYLSNGSLGYSSTEQRNEIYVSSFDAWQTFDLLALTSYGGLPIDQFQISFYFHNHYGRDYADRAALKADTVTVYANPEGLKRMIVDDDTSKTAIYTSEYSLDADSPPQVLRPDDYNSVTNPVVWRLDKIISLGIGSQITGLVSRIKFDNVSLAFYPNILTPVTQIIDPPETLTYSEEVDDLVEPSFDMDVLLGDVIRFDDEFTRNERYIYRSYLRLSDGTPTLNWHRSGVLEAKRILQITLEDYIAQFSEPQRKLSGAKAANTIAHFVNCLRDTIDGTRYRPMTFDFDVLNAHYSPNACAVIAGEDGDPPVNLGQFHCRQFSSAFKRGSCLAVGVFDETFDETFE